MLVELLRNQTFRQCKSRMRGLVLQLHSTLRSVNCRVQCEKGERMKTRWEAEPGRILCRWSEVGERTEYSPAWMQEASKSIEYHAPAAVPNFSMHSALGSGEWFVPWRLRWSVPSRSAE